MMLLWSFAHAEPWRPPVTRAMVDAEFAKFDARHPALKAERAAKLRPLADRLLALQTKGEPLFCSAQMLNELRWLLDATTQWSRIDRQLWLLGVSMEDEDQAFAIGQEAYDGSWGICYDEWFKKLDPMIQAIDAMAGQGVPPQYSQLQFPQPIDLRSPIANLLQYDAGVFSEARCAPCHPPGCFRHFHRDAGDLDGRVYARQRNVDDHFSHRKMRIFHDIRDVEDRPERHLSAEDVHEFATGACRGKGLEHTVNEVRVRKPRTRRCGARVADQLAERRGVRARAAIAGVVEDAECYRRKRALGIETLARLEPSIDGGFCGRSDEWQHDHRRPLQ